MAFEQFKNFKFGDKVISSEDGTKGIVVKVMIDREPYDLLVAWENGWVNWTQEGVIMHDDSPEPTETLRDKFAMAAYDTASKFVFDGYCGTDEVNGELIAVVAYQLADDMLKAREVKHD